MLIHNFQHLSETFFVDAFPDSAFTARDRAPANPYQISRNAPIRVPGLAAHWQAGVGVQESSDIVFLQIRETLLLHNAAIS